jgi:hypothetical protein
LLAQASPTGDNSAAVTTHTYRFFAPLSNALGHWEGVRLEPPFRIERWPIARIIRTWRFHESVQKFVIQVRMDGHQCRIEDRHAFVVTASVRLPYEGDPEDVTGAPALRFHQDLEGITARAARDLRSIALHLGIHTGLFDYYWYVQEGKKQYSIQSSASDDYVQPITWRIERRELPELNAFIRRMRKPVDQDYVRLAWDHWDHAFSAGPAHMQLLSLVMALEALFNVGQTDLRYRVARSMAVLLSHDADHAEHVFEAMKEAYDLRSKLVHTGKADLRKFWMGTLRTYVQRAILRLIDLDLPKDDIAEILTRLAFGEGHTITRRSRMVLTPRNRVLRINARLKGK